MEIIHLNVTSVLDLSSNFNMLNAMNMFDCSLLYSELYFFATDCGQNMSTSIIIMGGF